MDQDRDLTPQEQKRLLRAARQTIVSLVKREKPVDQKADLPGLGFARGAFVTLHRRGRLRGCIGNFFAKGNLLRTVEEMAMAAACQDPRFPPLSPAELAEIDLEISVLSPLREIKDVNEIKVGTHGIYLVSPRGRGVLLPQVATEYGWDRETFLDQTCLKAGLAPGCWRDADAQILIFSAQIFGEKEAE